MSENHPESYTVGRPFEVVRTGHARELTTAALIASLLAAAAWIQIPVQPVPITLQVFFVLLAALLLSPAGAFGALTVYLGMGAIGLPVFSGAQGGMGVLAGPTGGYLFGFLVAAGLGPSLRVVLEDLRVPRIASDVLAVIACLVAIYGVGTVQLAMVLELDAAQAIAAGAVPFILADAAKAVAAVVVASGVRKAVRF